MRNLGVLSRKSIILVVHEVGSTELGGVELGMPWHHVISRGKGIIGSETATQAIGDWLLGKNLVYGLSEPERMLRQREIHWDKQTCDVEDEDGTVFYNVSWDELEFAYDVQFHDLFQKGSSFRRRRARADGRLIASAPEPGHIRCSTFHAPTICCIKGGAELLLAALSAAFCPYAIGSKMAEEFAAFTM